MPGKRWPKYGVIRGIEIQVVQWEVLQLLEPGWLFLTKRAFHHNTRAGLVRRGWIEVKLFEGYMMVRLTPVGRELRDLIHIRNARRRERTYSNSGANWQKLGRPQVTTLHD